MQHDLSMLRLGQGEILRRLGDRPEETLETIRGAYGDDPAVLDALDEWEEAGQEAGEI
jgi:hypothetical protein